jgi:hypothetical protein
MQNCRLLIVRDPEKRRQIGEFYRARCLANYVGVRFDGLNEAGTRESFARPARGTWFFGQ